MAFSDGGKAILSIDGGGIRGIIPSLVLKSLEMRLKAAGKTKPLHHYFDLIVGTSTGGVIAAGLAAPRPGGTEPAMTADALVELYGTRGQDIFNIDRFRNLREAILGLNIDAIFQEKYSAKPLEELLEHHLGDRRLSEALTNVVITAYDIEKRKTAHLRGGPDIPSLVGPPEVRHDYLFRDAARATAAAPTYFEPAKVRNLATGETRALIDGGVFANQPAFCGYAQALALGWPSDKVHILSLGTGYQTRPFDYEDVKDWGALQWINPAKGAPIISILMHGQADSTDWNMEQMLVDRFDRLDRRLDPGKGNDDMDDASPENIAALTMLAEEIIQVDGATLDRWADGLVPAEPVMA